MVPNICDAQLKRNRQGPGQTLSGQRKYDMWLKVMMTAASVEVRNRVRCSIPLCHFQLIQESKAVDSIN